MGKEDVVVPVVIEAVIIMNIIVSSTKQKSLNVLIVILRPFVKSEATVSRRQ